MDPFQFNFRSPLTPPDHQVGNSFDMPYHDFVPAPGFQGFYQDEILYSADKQQQINADWPLSEYLNALTTTSSTYPSYLSNLIGGEPLFAVQSEPQHQYGLSNDDGVLSQQNNHASFDYHRAAHGFQYTSSTDALPAFSRDHCDTASAYYSTPIVKSQERSASSIQEPSAVQLPSERNDTPSSSNKTLNPSRGSTRRRLPKMVQGRAANGTNKSRYKCGLCDKTFSRPADRRRHENKTVRHGAIKRYPCDICKTAVLSRQSDVARHQEKCRARMQHTHPQI